MSPDDPRHGTSRGYVLGCRKDCCRRAQMIYMKQYRMGQRPRLVDPTGSIRRLHALACLGYSAKQLGAMVGKGHEWTRHLTRSTVITTTNQRLVAELYERLSMTPADHPLADRIRRESLAKGWSPPLAWDDETIDDPAAKPHGKQQHRKTDVDPVVVDRLLNGIRTPSTKAEKDEAMRHWLAMGRSEKSLCDAHGWHDSRYGRDAA